MSSSKPQKWSTSSSFSKLLNRLTRTLSFSSKKCQQATKKRTQTVKPKEHVVKNVTFVPQSAPLLRRHPPQSLSTMMYSGSKTDDFHYQPAMVRQNIRFEQPVEEEEDDCSRYSLRPNLSLFNISVENLPSHLHDFDEELPRQSDWLDEIFHSTKIDDY